MKLTNGWRSRNKNLDRVEIKLRVGFVTLFEFSADWSDKKWRVCLLNIFLSK